ncbi:uncharacterized protein [Asterias amurensis]|uniref:uncharacterized protein n=1 Tax=Asterias amurensis TaxID=7602 RepID=UPI003AB1DB28
MTTRSTNVNGSDTDRHGEVTLVAAAMTRQVTVSMGRRLSLEDLNDSSSQSELVSVDSPQNGDVDVVTVDNAAEVDSLIGSQKSPLGFSEMQKNSPKEKSQSHTSPVRPRTVPPSGSPKGSWPSPRSSLASPAQADLPDANRKRRFEPCILNKAKVWLPIELIEQSKVFHEVVSMDTWTNVLSDEDRERLGKMMPDFPESDAEEKQETLRRLFAGENFKFGNPVRKLQKDLKAGYLCLDVFKHKRALRRAKYQEYNHQQELRCHRMLKEVLISRQELLEAAQFTAPDEPFKVKRPRPLTAQKDLDEIVTKKYRKILRECRMECGELYTSDEDDNPSCGARDKTPTKKRPSSWYEAPSDITLPVFTPRVHSTFDMKPIELPAELQADGSVEEKSDPIPPSAPDSPLHLTEAAYMDMIEKHQRRRDSCFNNFELDTSHVSLDDIMIRTFSSQNSPIVPSRVCSKPSPLSQKRKNKAKDKLAKKRKKGRPPKVATPVSVVSIDSQISLATLESPVSISTNQEERSTPVEAVKDEEDVDIESSLKSMIYPNFFSFLRDTMKRSDNHFMTFAELEFHTEKWEQEPVSALNVWFTLMLSWSKVISSMLKFLIGELPSMPIKDPIVEQNEETKAWGWIGEGRDSDEQLTTLFKQWLTAVMEDKPTPPETECHSSPTVPSPIKVRTDYVVRPSNAEEKDLFRAQEHERYEQPHKAYTYHIHGYQSVVGPVKGVYSREASLNKAREHSLLVSDRPPYVTILSLVRDAVARLPNGEGTRSEVCELLKDSKFLVDATDNQINTVVSGALDRLHYEKDPCVKYDGNRKLWIYLHRNRIEEEFERLHLEQAVSVKAKRTLQKQPKPVQKTKQVIRDMPIMHQTIRPPSAMSDTSNDSIISVGMGLETLSPARSPGSSSISPHSIAKSPASSASQSSSSSLPGVKVCHRAKLSTFQPQLQRNIAAPMTLSGVHAYPSQVQALLTHAAMPSMLVPSSISCSEAGAAQSGNSLIRAQLLAPRGIVAQLSGHQVSAQMCNPTSSICTPQLSTMPLSSLMTSQAHTDALSRKDSLVVTKEGLVHASSKPITLTLTGTKAPGKSRTPPSSTIPAALAFHPGTLSKPGTVPVNVTLTLKGATEESKGSGSSRGHGGKAKLPTVGGLLAGLGMPLESSSSRGPKKATSGLSRSKSPSRAADTKSMSPGSARSAQSAASKKRSQQKTDAVTQDHIITFHQVTSSSLVQPQQASLLTSPLIFTSAAAGVQPTMSGLVFQPQVASHGQLTTASSRKTPPSLSATQASAIRTLTSLASQRKLKEIPSTSGVGTASGSFGSSHTELPSIPMSLLMSTGPHSVTTSQGLKTVSVVGSHGRSLPKGAIPVMTNPLLSAGIPANLAPGKGVILQVPIGSKLVSAIPSTSLSLNKPKITTPITVTSSALTSQMTATLNQGANLAAKNQPAKSTQASRVVTAHDDDKN